MWLESHITLKKIIDFKLSKIIFTIYMVEMVDLTALSHLKENEWWQQQRIYIYLFTSYVNIDYHDQPPAKAFLKGRTGQ